MAAKHLIVIVGGILGALALVLPSCSSDDPSPSTADASGVDALSNAPTDAASAADGAKDDVANRADASTDAHADAGADAEADACVRRKCSDYGATCGTPSDGCGGVLPSCGTCDGGVCSYFSCCTPGPQWSPLKSTTAVGDLPTSFSTRTWTNPSNAKQIDDVTADVAGMVKGEITHYLFAEGFGLAIPSNAKILGIEVSIRRKSLNGTGIVDTSVALLESGAPAGGDHAIKTVWSNTFTTAVYGGTGDLWGSQWTPAALNNPQFGVGLAVEATAADTPSVDSIQVDVEYSLPCP